MNQEQQFNQRLCEFLDASPTPFHAVSNIGNVLLKAGFTRLDEAKPWRLKPAGKYYVVRNSSSVVAFVVGSKPVVKSGLRLVGAHTDSPCLMVKPQPEISTAGYCQLGVEVYGGALLNPWFDRDLSIAGRLVYRDQQNRLKQKLVNFDKPIAVIPSLAIHLDQEANKGRAINAQKHIPPILMLCQEGEKGMDFRALLRQRFLTAEDQVLDYELSFYDTQRAAILGVQQEFLASARLDNLLSCFVATQSLLQADGTNSCIMVCNDHEEVGSVSAVGAEGPFLETVIQRIVEAECCEQTIGHIMDRSLLISCDNAHAVHPNFTDKHDPAHRPKLNAGPVIKTNVKQRYATSSLTASLFRQLCADADVPVQTFVSRSDMGCGSTIGPVASSRLGVPALDVGIPQLAMHSCRELIGSRDPLRMATVLKTFFNQQGNLNIELE